MPVSAIQIGLDPDGIDYGSPEFARIAGLTKDRLRAANDQSLAAMRAAGYEVDNCPIDFGVTAIGEIRSRLATKAYDAVLIGAGVRLVASNTLLFEMIVNLVHATQPKCRFVFNYRADDIRRWYPDPYDTAPVA